jgi:hypothetical protein
MRAELAAQRICSGFLEQALLRAAATRPREERHIRLDRKTNRRYRNTTIWRIRRKRVPWSGVQVFLETHASGKCGGRTDLVKNVEERGVLQVVLEVHVQQRLVVSVRDVRQVDSFGSVLVLL